MLRNLNLPDDRQAIPRLHAYIRAAEHVIRMEVAINAEDIEGWFLAHGHFHRLLTSKADESLLRQLRTYSDRSIRYLRLYTQELGDWQRSRHPEHIAIYTAVADHDTDLAVRRLALHLAGVAEHIMAARDPNYVGKSVRRALRLVGVAEIASALPHEQIQDSTRYLPPDSAALA